MKKTYYLLLSLFMLSLTFSCDVIEKDNFTDPNADFPWLGKKVLIEDFTGYKNVLIVHKHLQSLKLLKNFIRKK